MRRFLRRFSGRNREKINTAESVEPNEASIGRSTNLTPTQRAMTNPFQQAPLIDPVYLCLIILRLVREWEQSQRKDLEKATRKIKAKCVPTLVKVGFGADAVTAAVHNDFDRGRKTPLAGFCGEFSADNIAICYLVRRR
ncbi:MAG: hypothetical protein M1816_004527 [Peltula sp. TS41687]|nr:MAG: hypothetical protein M1816_004527 [Peltula sp. TS41687]